MSEIIVLLYNLYYSVLDMNTNYPQWLLIILRKPLECLRSISMSFQNISKRFTAYTEYTLWKHVTARTNVF